MCARVFIILFIYLVLVALGLHCRTGFSLVSASGGYSSGRAQASHCGGFSYCGAWAIGCKGSVVVVPGL